ncbi:hypothetical protein [Burkholderia ubonensis]|uniref:hypothetical protein n=1 Tax=Burkholderia ubonensis TaxID=101571 RepID=UPI0008FE31D8|nr:hypothetical protein [Burkholderia ubonensis]OJA51881.1 hypothetical protein BGV69_30255 [Burkholderia ubonensis]
MSAIATIGKLGRGVEVRSPWSPALRWGYYDGDYIPASTFEAGLRPDLLSLKVVAGNQQNAAARALLGKDYVTLVDMIDVRGKGGDEDALGANVNEYFVRDIANTGHGNEKGRHIAGLSKKQMVPRRGLGHAGATPAALASAAFRVLTQSAQALCFLG